MLIFAGKAKLRGGFAFSQAEDTGRRTAQMFKILKKEHPAE